MKFSLAAQFLSTAFAAAVASPSSVSVAEEVAKKYGNHRDIDAAAAAAATSLASRNLDSTHSTSTSKSSKSSSYCPPEPTKDVQCGNVYNSTATGEEVVVILGENLLCDENITLADGSNNAALTLSGKDAVLNCQGYTISQTTVNVDGIDKGSAAAVDCPIFPTSTERLRMKQECGLFYEWGVTLEGGARMINCNIQKFWGGADIRNGGEIQDSEFSLNRRGVNLSNRAANSVSKVVNSEIYSNYGGITVYQYNTEDSSKVMIEDVAAKNNEDLGMYLTGTGITVNNANIKNSIDGLGIGSNVVNEITLAGDITATNNEYGFFTYTFTKGAVYITGNLISNHNVYGVDTSFSNLLTIDVGGSNSGKSGKSGSGSLTACGNGQYDIDNVDGVTFVGSDYTCDTTDGFPESDCKPCYPGCDEPSEETSQTMAQETVTMDSFMAGNHHKADEHEPTPAY